MPLLNVKELTVVFADRHKHLTAVDNASFMLEQGELLGIVGESGAGKSTIGNAILRLIDPPGKITQGQIYLHDEEITSLDDSQIRQIRGRKIGMIFQDPMSSLNPVLSIKQQMMEMILVHQPLSKSEAYAKMLDYLHQVGIPEPELRCKHYPHEFSGGMRQRIVIALVIAGEPELLIADEPTTALDVTIQAQIIDLIKDICSKKKMGLILITHDISLIRKVAQRVIVMYKGRIVEEGDVDTILSKPSHPYTIELMASVPKMDVKTPRFPVAEERSEAHKKAGQLLKQRWAEYSAIEGPLLTVNDLYLTFDLTRFFIKRYRKKNIAIHNVSFEINAGDIFGLVGESGSGKSSVARSIAGLYHPQQGDIHFVSQSIGKLSTRKRPKQVLSEIQMIFQDPYASLNASMKVKRIIAEPMRHFQPLLSKQDINNRIDMLLRCVDLPLEAKNYYPHEFSGGQRQRIAIARAIASHPRLLICDEPTSSLDVSVQAKILNLLKDLQEELNLTMLFISHDLPVIRQMCNTVAVMKEGKIVEMNDCETLFTQPTNPYTQSLLADI